MLVILLLTAALGFSIFGAASLLVLKRYEITTGRVVFGQSRPKVGAFFHTGLVWFEHKLPALLAKLVLQGVEKFKKVLHIVVARAILSAEGSLVWILKKLHYTTHPTSGSKGEVSAFLREVAEHKKNFLKRKQK